MRRGAVASGSPAWIAWQMTSTSRIPILTAAPGRAALRACVNGARGGSIVVKAEARIQGVRRCSGAVGKVLLSGAGAVAWLESLLEMLSETREIRPETNLRGEMGVALRPRGEVAVSVFDGACVTPSMASDNGDEVNVRDVAVALEVAAAVVAPEKLLLGTSRSQFSRGGASSYNGLSHGSGNG